MFHAGYRLELVAKPVSEASPIPNRPIPRPPVLVPRSLPARPFAYLQPFVLGLQPVGGRLVGLGLRGLQSLQLRDELAQLSNGERLGGQRGDVRGVTAGRGY